MFTKKLIQLVIGSVLAIFLLTGCGNSAAISTPVPPTVTPTVLPTIPATPADIWQAFISSRYNYSMKYPANWLVTESEGEWEISDVLYPSEPGVDTFRKLNANDIVSVGVQVLTSQTALNEWTKTNTDLIHSQLSPCGEPESQTQVSLAGEPAVQLTYHCTDGYYLIWVFNVHDDKGYIVLWASRTGNEAGDQIMFEQFLSGFAFTD